MGTMFNGCPHLDELRRHDFHIVGRVQTDSAVFPALAPTLLVLILELIENFA